MKFPGKQLALSVLAAFGVCATPALSQIEIVEPKEGTASPFTYQAVTGRTAPNMPVRLEVDGLPADSALARPDGVFEFLGVRCPRGPVTFRAVMRMTNGREFAAERSMHVFGDPDSIDIRLESTAVPADGTTTLRGTAAVLDRWRKRIPAGYFLTINADSLQVLEEDADQNAPGHQLRLADGKADFTLRAGHAAGPMTVTFSTNSITAASEISATTPAVPFMFVGSADGTLRHLSTAGETAGLSPSADFDPGLHPQGRLAVTGRGNIFTDYLLTLSVDTDRKLQDQIFRDLDPNSLYSMYGDNSIVTYDAQSSSPLYAKLERNRSYLLYGDFNTQMTRSEFAAYNRSFTGGKLHLQEGPLNLDAFGTLTNRKVVQEELRGLGISGYYYLARNNLVTGSEKVRIEVRDRFHSEIVISVREKVRYSDYEVDYIQGSLYFKQPVPSLDDRNNPVYIVVSYEAISNTADNLVTGGSGEVSILDAVTLGGTAVVEERNPRNYVLWGGSTAVTLGRAVRLRGEAAGSSDAGEHGKAWKVEADFRPGKWMSLQPYFRKVDPSFTNPTQSGSGREVGTTKYGSAVRADPADGTTLTGDFYEQRQSQGTFATRIRSLSGGIQQSLWDRGSVGVRLEDVRYEGENPEAPSQDLNTHSTILSSKAEAGVTDRLRATAEYEHNLRKAEKEVRPDAVGVGLEYRVTASVAVYAQQRFLQGEGRLTTIGVNTQILEGTSVYGKYEVGNAISGERNAASIGLKNTLKITPDLTANVLYEKTRNLGKQLAEARTDDHDAASASLEYLPAGPLKGTIKGEYGEDINNLRKGFDAGLTYRLNNDLSLVAKGTDERAESRTQTGHTREARYLLGLAFRPVSFNWLNLIMKGEYRIHDNRVVQPVQGSRATIVSAHAFLELFPDFELGMKYALKNAREETGDLPVRSVTDFILCRPQYDLTGWMNLAAEARLLRQWGANDMKVGYSTEAGFVFIRNTMLCIGYNFQAYEDRDLVGWAYSVRGPYVTIRLKFTEDLLGAVERDG